VPIARVGVGIVVGIVIVIVVVGVVASRARVGRRDDDAID
jgi:hypothetical protein|tara:strand:+ start:2118 stop:2237 length:120 start_codon:yes stop_codon:yes gene_type:complete